MRTLSALALLLVLTACGGGNDEGGEAGPTSAATETSSSEPTEAAPASPSITTEPTDCLVAAAKWSGRAEKHLRQIRIQAGFGEKVDVSDLDDLTSEIGVLCSDELVGLVESANTEFSLAAYEVALCAVKPSGALGGCTLKAMGKIGRILDKAEGYVEQANELIDRG